MAVMTQPALPIDRMDGGDAMISVTRECGMGGHAANDLDAAPLQFLRSGRVATKAKYLEVEADSNQTGGQLGRSRFSSGG